MKRYLAILTALILALTFASCSSGDSGGTGTNGENGGNGANGSGAIRTPADFEGKMVAVQNATTADIALTRMVDEDGMNIEIIRYPQVISCFDDLRAGRVDAVYVDSVVAAYYTTGRAEFNRVWLSNDAEPLGICLRKDSENLRDAICAAVDMLYYNGEMAKIGERHFGNDFDSARIVTEEPTIPSVSDEDLITPGVLMIGCEVGYPPMEYFDEDGTTPIGFDIDVGKAVAELLGLEWRLVNTGWDGIFDALDRGDYDVIISSVSITEPRQERFLFTKPYIANAMCIVIAN
jgi:ABC-type amino acid transport substrate-binding protein